MRLFVWILTLSCLTAQALADMPPGWVAVPGPPTKRDSVCGLYQQVFWRVYTVVGGIAVKSSGDEGRRHDWLPEDVDRAAPDCDGKRVVVSDDSGYLVGCDNGEFGGGLSWIARDGSSSELLCRGNVPFLIPQDQGAIALASGCDPLDGGRAYRVALDEDGTWTVAEIADLGTAPSVAVRESAHSVLVGTWGGVWRVTPDSAEQLVSGHTWRPTSLVLHPDGTVYMGMSHYVLRFTVNDPTAATWYAPAECAAFGKESRPDEGTLSEPCQCIAAREATVSVE